MGAFLQWTTPTGESKALFFDVVTDEGQTLSATSTDSPVEEGPDVSDHIRRENNRCSLSVFVSNEPIEDVNSRGGRMTKVEINPPRYKPPLAPTPGALFSAIGSAITNTVDSLLGGGPKQIFAQVLQFPNEFDAVAETIATFETLLDTKQLVDVVIPSRYYEGMMVEKVAVSRDASTGNGAKISIDFKQIQTVHVSIVTAPIPTELRGAATKKKGAKSAKDDKAPEKKKAILKGLIDVAKGALH